MASPSAGVISVSAATIRSTEHSIAILRRMFVVGVGLGLVKEMQVNRTDWSRTASWQSTVLPRYEQPKLVEKKLREE